MSDATENFLANGGRITYSVPHTSFIMINPAITEEGVVFRPLVDIYWNLETECIDVRYEGSVSDAAKVLCDQFAARMWEYFKAQIKLGYIKEQGE